MVTMTGERVYWRQQHGGDVVGIPASDRVNVAVMDGWASYERVHVLTPEELAAHTAEAERRGAEAGDQHCPSCTCGKRAPVQGEHAPPRRAPGSVTWAEHLEAYDAYAARWGTSQSAQRLAERGGFGYREITELLGREPTTWVVRGADQIKQARERQEGGSDG